ALLERGRTGEAYNLCSGDGVSIAEVIALLRTHARVPVRVHSDPALRRAHGVAAGTAAHRDAARRARGLAGAHRGRWVTGRPLCWRARRRRAGGTRWRRVGISALHGF